MSVVVVMKTDDEHILVADSAMSTPSFVNIKAGVKIHRIGEDVILGFCGNPEVLTMFKAHVQENPIGAVETFDESRAYAYMSDFYDYIGTKGFSVMGESAENFEVAIITPWRILVIERYFVQEVENYFAIGSGDEVAKSALHLGKSAEEAATVACELTPWCSLPLTTCRIQRKHNHDENK